MRDKKRIKRILSKIESYWEKHPDLRFTQMLIGLKLIPDGGHWGTEDDETEKVLDEGVGGMGNGK